MNATLPSEFFSDGFGLEVVLSDDLSAVCEEAVLILEDVALLCRQDD